MQHPLPHAARGSILALCLTLSACGGEQFRNIGSLKTSVETFDPFEFTIGNFFIDARNGDFDAHVVTRTVDADGSIGEVLAVNQYMLGSEGDFVVHLDAPMRGPSNRFHVGVYMNTDGAATWDPSEPAATIDGVPFEGTIDVTFTSSVLNTESPFYHVTCGMGTGTTDERHLAYKTTLDYDCRCSLPTVSPRTGKTYGWDFEALAQWSNMCGGAGDAGNGLTLGEGPQLKAIQGRMTNGDIWEDRNEIIFGVKWGSLSDAVDPRLTIMAIDMTTGARRVVSGEFIDPARGEYVVGDGPLGIPFIGTVQRGPDGKIYALSVNHKILRIDPDTGDRELIWAREDEAYPQCDNGVQPEGHPDWRLSDGQPGILQLSIDARGLVVAPDGSFYIPTRANGVPRPGYGIIRVAADGSACDHASMSTGEERNAYADGIGSGIDFDSGIDTMIWHEGKLITITVGADVYEVDPQTGDRVRLAGQGLTGSPTLPRVNRMFWDPGREVFVLTGVLPPNGSNIITWDPDTQDTYAYLCRNMEDDNALASQCVSGPLATRPIAALPGYLRSDGMILHGFAAGGFHIYEMLTGNSHWFTY